MRQVMLGRHQGATDLSIQPNLFNKLGFPYSRFVKKRENRIKKRKAEPYR